MVAAKQRGGGYIRIVRNFGTRRRLIENFSFDTGCSFTVASTAGSSNGVVAGLVYDATVRDITSSAPMLFQGAAGNVRITMALIGTAFAETANGHDRQREQQRHDHGRKPRQQYERRRHGLPHRRHCGDSPPTTGLRSRKSSSPTASTTATSPPRQDAPRASSQRPTAIPNWPTA